jgi:hypothetical protein
MWLMRRRDPQDREDGFCLLLPHAGEHVEEPTAELVSERDDHGLRCWLLELIGTCGPVAAASATASAPTTSMFGAARSSATSPTLIRT